MTITTQDLNLPSQYSQEDIVLMRETICKGCTPADFKLFLLVCQRTRLDPFARQIYAVPRWDAKLGRNSMTIQTSIDGLRLVAERTGKYAPGKATEYGYDQNGNIRSATAFVKKQTTDGTWHEIAYTAFFEEYCQRTKDGKPTKFWKDMAHVMIAKVAEAACLRRAFPMELSGLYTKDEMEQAEIEIVESSLPEKLQEDSEAIAIKLKELLSNFSEEEQPLVTKYLDKWCATHMKSSSQALERYAKVEDLRSHFATWKEKQNGK